MRESVKFSPEVRERGAHGDRAPWGAQVAVGSGGVDRRQNRQHERDTGLRDGLTTAEAQRLKKLERENRELRKANEVLKLASAFVAQAEHLVAR